MLKSLKYLLTILGIWFHLALPAQLNLPSYRLPIIVIETGGREIVDDPRITAHMGVIYNGEGQTNSMDDPFNNYYGRISIEIRGSTSQDYPKKSYGLETQQDNGDNLNVSLIDLPEENDWILYAPYTDKSLIRNILAYRLSRELGHYAPRTRLCELVVNDDYKGVYVLVEKIKRDRNRVDIHSLDTTNNTGDELTGGYIVKIDKLSGHSGDFWTTDRGGIYFQYEYPGFEDISAEQKAYIQGYVNSFESSLVAHNFDDPELGYRQYLDVASAVDFFLVNELAKNVDAYILSSTFLYKDRGGKLHMGPVWDFNLAFGLAEYRDAYKSSGFQLEQNEAIWWWDRLLQDPLFIADVKQRWQEVREAQFSNEHVLGIIDSLSTFLSDVQKKNFVRWDILGRPIWPEYFVGSSFNEEIAHLRSWTEDRLQWMDEALMDWTGKEEQATDTGARAYPNPSLTRFTFEFSLEQERKVELALYDMGGRLVHTYLDGRPFGPGSHHINCPVDGLPSSIYFLVMKVDDRMQFSEKILKIR